MASPVVWKRVSESLRSLSPEVLAEELSRATVRPGEQSPSEVVRRRGVTPYDVWKAKRQPTKPRRRAWRPRKESEDLRLQKELERCLRSFPEQQQPQTVTPPRAASRAASRRDALVSQVKALEEEEFRETCTFVPDTAASAAASRAYRSSACLRVAPKKALTPPEEEPPTFAPTLNRRSAKIARQLGLRRRQGGGDPPSSRVRLSLPQPSEERPPRRRSVPSEPGDVYERLYAPARARLKHNANATRLAKELSGGGAFLRPWEATPRPATTTTSAPERPELRFSTVEYDPRLGGLLNMLETAARSSGDDERMRTTTSPS